MRRFAVPFVLAFLAGTVPAAANVVVTIDKSTQRMSVAVDGATRYSFAVSTGRAGYGTPNGTYHPERLARTWFSKKYYNSPMPHSIFFHGGFAIHGSYEISRLGGPASHGCVRLHPSNAATLYALVQQEGVGNTRIVITGYQQAPAYPYVQGPVYRYDRWQ
jgi:lipoprotein-anchoring transpeptidase ErfK/SrfK